jgi:uncharacterized membrane protein
MPTSEQISTLYQRKQQLLELEMRQMQLTRKSEEQTRELNISLAVLFVGAIAMVSGGIVSASTQANHTMSFIGGVILLAFSFVSGFRRDKLKSLLKELSAVEMEIFRLKKEILELEYQPVSNN